MVRMFLAIGKPCRLRSCRPQASVFGDRLRTPYVENQGAYRSLFRDDSALSIDFDLVHTVVGQPDQVAPVFATFGL